MRNFFSLILSLIFWGVFGYTIFLIPYPDSLTSATLLQLISFFIPLFLALTLTINIFLRYLISSVILAASLIIILFLQALYILNFVTATLVAVAIFLLINQFQKRKSKTKLPKVGKALRLNSKPEEGTLSKLKRIRLP